MNQWKLLLLLLLTGSIFLPLSCARHRADAEEYQRQLGSPQVALNFPEDTFPPLDFPAYVPADAADWLADEHWVLTAEFNGEAAAWPTRILNYHEIVNDTLGGVPIVATYCPLCHAGIVYSRVVDGRTLTFGNSGSLYESNLLLYDRETRSVWFQTAGAAIEGVLKGRRLELLPSQLTTWGEWRARHPRTKVLSLQTGFRKPYKLNRYRRYERRINRMPRYPVSLIDTRLPPKERVIGMRFDGAAKAWPLRLLKNKTVTDQFAGRTLEFIGDAAGKSARVRQIGADGARLPLPVVNAYWFIWVAAHPQTLLYIESAEQPASPAVHD